ncbi:MAG: FKBP-type peptidyl-prolyl cis-trans isomerase FkpA [Patescibacteria group bacterium]|nr:FKBP-type peptidyl-prolyl cis-trans isomerase FkpA [Patescibacteria group bacterium]
MKVKLKNNLTLITIVIIAILLLMVASYFVWRTFIHKDTVVQQSTVSSSDSAQPLNPTNTESISLNSNKPQSGPNALSVKEPSDISASLGSGQKQSTSSGSSSSNSSQNIPGPETFGAFEQYKDSQSVMYQDLQVGTGAEVTADSQVAVLYKGYLTSGALFDQSRAGNDGKLQPFIFSPAAGQVIAGFAQGVMGTKAGSVRRVIIPPTLGYGAEAQNGIPANSVLVFDIQVISVQ